MGMKINGVPYAQHKGNILTFFEKLPMPRPRELAKLRRKIDREAAARKRATLRLYDSIPKDRPEPAAPLPDPAGPTIDVACPSCDAPSGERCVTRTGKKAKYLHKTRVS